MNILEDHRIMQKLIVDLNEDLNKGELDIDQYTSLEKRLRDHIFIEETVIFPKLSSVPGIKDLLTGLKVEHGSFWMLMEKIDKSLDTESYWQIPRAANEMLMIMQEHDLREEKSIDPLILNMDLPTLLERPTDWKCEKAPKLISKKSLSD